MNVLTLSMAGIALFPNRRRIPCRWESSQIQRNIRVIFQQLAQTVGPLALWRYPQKQPFEQSKHRERPAVVQCHGQMPLWLMLSVGHERSNSQISIPQARMMGAEVADIVHGKQPVLQHVGRKPDPA